MFDLRPYFPIVIGLLFSCHLAGQVVPHPGDTITCYWNDTAEQYYIDPPQAFSEGGEPRSSFSFDFIDVPDSVRAPIIFASEIWETMLTSEVPIRVEVTWMELEQQALAAAGPTTLFRGITGAPDPFIWYPVALAEAIVGDTLNENSNPDIVVRVNNQIDWYLGTDGNTPRGRFDLATVVLHELGHGLGFLSSSTATDTTGMLGLNDIPFIYDEFLVTGNERQLTNPVLFDNPSKELLDAFTGNNLFFDSPTAADFNDNRNPRIFAPSNFDRGSSISHLDEFAFRSDAEGALMTPRISSGEAIHRPGNITLGIMREIGWNALLTSTRAPEIAGRPLRAFPNPSNGRLTLELPELEGQEGVLSLYDLNGRELYRQAVERIDGSNLPLNLNGMGAGTYVLKLQSAREVYRTLVVRQ